MENKGRLKAHVLENTKDKSGLHITSHSSNDKLAGMCSLSTNCKTCDGCQANRKAGLPIKAIKDGLKKEIQKQDDRIARQMKKADPGKRNMDIVNDATSKRNELIEKINNIFVPVCAYCFAENLLDYKKNIQDPLQTNSDILSTRILEDIDIPFINRLYFRFESFGDLINEVHAINYIKIALKNPDCNFAWWTKRPAIIKKALETLDIDMPSNVNVILSSYYVNKIQKIDINKYPFIKAVFTVFDNYYLEKHPEIEISCGTRQCLNCFKCYRYMEPGTIVYINELVK